MLCLWKILTTYFIFLSFRFTVFVCYLPSTLISNDIIYYSNTFFHHDCQAKPWLAHLTWYHFPHKSFPCEASWYIKMYERTLYRNRANTRVSQALNLRLPLSLRGRWSFHLLLSFIFSVYFPIVITISVKIHQIEHAKYRYLTHGTL